MPDSVLAQHPPAVKVGGRRLSVSTKHKPHVSPETASTESSPSLDDEVTDYPRPAAPGEEHPHQRPPHNEEEVPVNKHNLENDQKLKKLAHQRIESTRPTRDLNSGGKHAIGAGGRISQPAGRGIGV